MQTIENDSAVVPFTPTNAEASPQGSYEPVRYNALKHGILSSQAVLPHENGGEFADLLAALIEEHNPAGMTERHLIEELAAIVWRKRRVLLAEGATINQGLKSAVKNAESVIPSAAPFQGGLTGKGTDLRDVVTATPDEREESLQYADLDLKATQRARDILYKGGANAYEKARRALHEDSRDAWDSNVEDESYTADAEGLGAWISEWLMQFCSQQEVEARYQPAIKAQTLGEGLQAHRLEKLNRYETHLDRKFERTLAMLLKLKQLRSAG
ncbi:MAG: hypothetical protein WAW10_08145 [Gallionella sp.]